MKHFFRKLLPLVLALALLCALAPGALAGDGELTITPSSPQTINVKETVDLTATVTHDDPDDTVTWKITQNDDVAKLNQITTKSGQSVTVTGLAAGEATITATCSCEEQHSDTCTIEVKSVPVTGVTLSQVTLNLKVGEKGTLTATVRPDNATDQTVTWTVNGDAVSLSPGTTESGDSVTVTAGKKGQATIKATCGGEEATCTVTVTEATVSVESITLSPTTLGLTVDESKSLTATVSPNTATDQTVTWTVTKGGENVSLDKTTGKSVTVTGKKEGEAEIKATCGGKEAICKVTVSKAIVHVKSVEMDRSELSLVAGTTATLKATVTPSGATNQKLTWRTDGKAVSLSKEETTSGDSVTITAHSAGTVKVTAVADDGGESASCVVTVTEVEIPAALGNSGSLVFGSLTGTLETYCKNITGSSLDYLTNIYVRTTAGTLYEGYVSEAEHGEGVSTATKYYNSNSGANQLGRVTFVPRTGYTGDAKITFSAYSKSGDIFTGSIVIPVAGTTLIYTSESGEPVRFRPSDFENYSRTNGHNTFRYVKFTLPSASYGTLYYNYIDSDINEGPISSSTLYYRAGSPALEKVWFVPNPSFSGIVSINFTYADTSGNTYSGLLQVQVVNAAGSDSGLSYSVRPGETVWFTASDFNDLSRELTGYPLNYVRFTSLPASSRGTLYCYGYGAVTTSQNIYRTGTSGRLLSDVYFTSQSSYAGTVSIPFTGYTTGNNRSFSGTVTITVSTSAGSTDPNTNFATGSIITYSSKGEAVTFRSQDFFYDAAQHLDQPLNTVRFYAPEVSQGRLCLNYVSPTNYASLDTSKEYPYGRTSEITFQPRAGFSGAAYIHFIATDLSGKSYTGTLAVNVDPPVSSGYFDDMGGHPWAITSVDFLARNNIVSGVAYRTYSPAGQTRRGDFILMLQRCFNFAGGGETAVFSDVSPWSYYGSAIAGAYAIGLAAGDGNGLFRPNATLTRQEASMFLYRCMTWSGSLQDGTAADLAAFSDRGQVADYAVTAMATLVRLGVLTGDNNGRLNPTQSLTRAEMAVMFHRALT